MKNAILSAGVAVGSVFLAGCGTTAPDALPVFDLAHATDETIATQFAPERVQLKGRKPTIGLALSGGGTKAAMFAHGVLHGLHDHGVLDHVDAISSASGGGYAAYWYYSKLMEAQRTGFDSNDIFKDCFPYWWMDASAEPKLKRAFALGEEKAIDAGRGVCKTPYHLSVDQGDPYRWQAHLWRWPDVFRQEITEVTGNAQKAPIFGDIGLLFSAFAEVAVGWTQSYESSLVQAYQAGIEREWGLNPSPRKLVAGGTPESERWAYSNASKDSRNSTALRAEPKSMQWDQLQELYKTNPKTPLWILNTNSGNKGPKPNLNHLFELTPFGYGSPEYGWKNSPPIFLKTVATGVRAQAAFLDSQGLGSTQARSALEIVAGWLPAARWGVTAEVEYEGKTKEIRLSDGGGVDNSGLVSLVRRGLDDIIIVDAAQDVAGRMEDLCWSRQALDSEGLEMKFENLDELAVVCGEGPKPKAYNVSSWLNPVLKGEILWRATGRVTRLWLIKAAWNQQEIRRAYNEEKCGYGEHDVTCELLVFYGHNLDAKIDGSYMVFPQHGTASSVLNSSSYQIFGYRELGRMLASRIRRDTTTGTLAVVGTKERKQPSFESNGKRPGPKLPAKYTDSDIEFR